MEEKKYNPVAWFEIYVDDMDRATKFYETVLNVKLEEMPVPGDAPMTMRCFPGFENGIGASGTLVKMDGLQAGGNSTIVYFGCYDCTVEESRVVEAGGKVHQPKMSIGNMVFVRSL
jgi:predicted enzyme related to lactoylglutathione lyase